MSPYPKTPPPVACEACGRSNDVTTGRTNCIDCQTPLPAPWGGGYLDNPEGGNS